MDKNTDYFGIDISMKTFDVYGANGEYLVFENNQKGYRKFGKLLGPWCHCVMESTGHYHYRLARHLSDMGVRVTVENPLSIKRFIQMRLSRVKTDKSDARMIYEYAQVSELRIWEEGTRERQAILQLISLSLFCEKQRTALKNKLHGEEVLGKPSTLAVSCIRFQLLHIKKQQDTVEKELLSLVRQDHGELLKRIETIKGIGRKTALFLIVVTNGFEKFENASQLCSFAGTTPIIRQSGSSLKSRARISKMGNRRLRKLLFMCSFSARRYNKTCRELYERLLAKGKSKKSALLAVCNKLLKQAFAIAKSGQHYDAQHCGSLAR
jgi:transposase